MSAPAGGHLQGGCACRGAVLHSVWQGAAPFCRALPRTPPKGHQPFGIPSAQTHLRLLRGTVLGCPLSCSLKSDRPRPGGRFGLRGGKKGAAPFYRALPRTPPKGYQPFGIPSAQTHLRLYGMYPGQAIRLYRFPNGVRRRCAPFSLLAGKAGCVHTWLSRFCARQRLQKTNRYATMFRASVSTHLLYGEVSKWS